MNKKSIIIGCLAIVIILVASIGGTYYFYNNDKETNAEPSSMNENENFIVEDNNTNENNVTENVAEENNNINNIVTQNTTDNEVNEQNVTTQQNTVSTNNNSELESSSDEEKAIDIVKKDWGSEDGVDFKIQTTDSNGNYVVAVYNPDTSAVLAWYTVNPKTGEFTN